MPHPGCCSASSPVCTTTVQLLPGRQAPSQGRSSRQALPAPPPVGSTVFVVHKQHTHPHNTIALTACLGDLLASPGVLQQNVDASVTTQTPHPPSHHYCFDCMFGRPTCFTPGAAAPPAPSSCAAPPSCCCPASPESGPLLPPASTSSAATCRQHSVCCAYWVCTMLDNILTT